jgi:tetratricopeptide (TPR) repeat protein
VAYADDASTSLRRRLAEALFRARRHLEAALTIEDLLEAEPEKATTEHRLMLAECYLSLGRHADASEQSRMILDEQGGNARALRLLARAQGAQADYPEALRTARRALAVEPNNVHTLELVAALAWRVENHELAASTVDRLLQRDPANPVGARIREQLRYRQTPGTRH